MNAAEDLAQRLARVQARMLARGINGLVVYFDGQHFMLRFNPLLYLSDFKALGPAFLFVPCDGEPALLVSPDWDLARAIESVPFATAKGVPQLGLAQAAATQAPRSPSRAANARRSHRPVSSARLLDADARGRGSDDGPAAPAPSSGSRAPGAAPSRMRASRAARCRARRHAGIRACGGGRARDAERRLG
jgi:hypothetical protein